MKIFYLLLLFFIFQSLLDAQSGWNYVCRDYRAKSIFFPDSNIGYAVDDIYGTILKTTDIGNSWFVLDSKIRCNLNSVYFINILTGFAVGGNGWGYRSDVIKTTDGGVSWIRQNPQTKMTINSICFPNENTGYIAGENGIIRKTTNGGLKWFKQDAGSNILLFSIYFTNPQTGWATGGIFGYYTILHTTDAGRYWVSQIPNKEDEFFSKGNSLQSVYFINSNTGFIVGQNSTVWKTTDGGKQWKLKHISTYGYLLSVFFVNDRIGYIGGDGGFLKTDDGGQNWKTILQIEEIGSYPQSIYFINVTTGFISGSFGIMKTTTGGE